MVAQLSTIQWHLSVAVFAAAVLVMLAMSWLLIRHQLLLRRRCSFVSALRLLGPEQGHETRTSKWMLGVAHYCGGDVEWYRPTNPLFTPSLVMHRGDLEMVEHHLPTPDDRSPFQGGQEIVTLAIRGGGKWSRCQFVVDRGVLTGMMSWLEAAPPGGANYLTARTS